MKRPIAALLSTLACAVLAQPAPAPGPNAQAIELAQKLGREANAEGLETIIKTRNWDLLQRYVSAYGQGAIRYVPGEGPKTNSVPKDLEAIMLRYYADDEVGPRLWGLCGSNSGARCESQELFDRMLAEYRSGKPRNRGDGLFAPIVRSGAPGAEAALTKWLTAPDAPKGQARNEVVMQLGLRKYAPAVPAISSLLNANPPGTPGNETFALRTIQSQEAAEALLSRLAALKRAPQTPEAVKEARSIGMELAQFPPTIAIPYARMRAGLPEEVRDYAPQWLSKRGDLAALPDVLVLVGQTPTFNSAFNAVANSDSPDVWKQARAAVEKGRKEGRLGEGEYKVAVSQLDEKIANPGKVLAQRAADKNDREFQTHMNLLNRDLQEARKLKASNPDSYVTAMREYLDAASKLAADYPDAFQAKNLEVNTLSNVRIDLANFVRFRQKHPREAIEIYESARAKGNELAGFAIADTLQYDMHDTKGAPAEYRKLVKPIPALPPGAMQDNSLAYRAWAQRWLAAQVAYLESGKKFSGVLKDEDMLVVAFLMGGPGQNDIFELAPLMRVFTREAAAPNSTEVARKVNALPTSAFALQASAMFVALLPDADSILAYLARQDPAGYASACYFGYLQLAEESGQPGSLAGMGMLPGVSLAAMHEAKARFLKTRHIDLTEVRKLIRGRQ